MTTDIGKHAPRCCAIGKGKKRLFVDLFPTAELDENAFFTAVIPDDDELQFKMESWKSVYVTAEISTESDKDGFIKVIANCVCNRPAYKANGKCYVHGGKTRDVTAKELKRIAARAGMKHGAYAKKVAINPEGIMYCDFCRCDKICEKFVKGGDCWYEREISNRTWKGFRKDLGELSEADRLLIGELIALLITKFRYNKYLNFTDLVQEKTWIHPKTGKPVKYDKLAVGLAHMLELTPQVIAIMRELKATRAIREPEPERHEFIFQLGKKEELQYPKAWKDFEDEPEENIIDVDFQLQEEEKKNQKVKVKVKKKKGKITEVEIESDFVWNDG